MSGLKDLYPTAAVREFLELTGQEILEGMEALVDVVRTDMRPAHHQYRVRVCQLWVRGALP